MMTIMTRQHEKLSKALGELSELLHKYGHDGQGNVVDEIIASLETPDPDYKRLAGIDMWGGAGSVADICENLTTKREGAGDERVFRKALVRVAAAMDDLKIGTKRSRSVAKSFRGLLDWIF